jgi:hypothetical protein
MVVEASHGVVQYFVGQKLMKLRTNHYFDDSLAKLNLHWRKKSKRFNQKRWSVDNENYLPSHELFMATSSPKGVCDFDESLIESRISNQSARLDRSQ